MKKDPFETPKPEVYKISEEELKETFNEKFFELPEEERNEIITTMETQKNDYLMSVWEETEKQRLARKVDLKAFPKLADALAKRKARFGAESVE